MKRILLLLTIGFTFLTAQAQVPQKMNYQAVIRDASQALLTSAPVGVRISVLQGSVTGTAVFVETHTANTNANGLLTLEIGNGTAQTGTFAGIDWSLAPYFLQTETDPTGGTNYTLITTSEMLSVPYALYAATSGNPIPGKSAYQEWLDQGNTGTEADFLTSLTGAQGSQGIQGNPGNDGQSAYDLWLSLGNTGTEADFMASLTGPQGPQGAPGTNGSNGADGSGAYTNWLNQGNTGTEADFLATLVGPQGPPGTTLVNGGKHTLILTDDINDADAAQQIADEVGPNTQEILINECTQLTTVDLSGIGKAVRVVVTDNAVLTSLNMGNMTVVYDGFSITDCPNLNTVNLAALEKVSSGSFTISNTGVATLDLPAIKKIGSALSIQSNPLLTDINAPLMEKLNSINIVNNALLNGLSMPLASTAVFSTLINVDNNASFTALNLSGLLNAKNITIKNNASLITISLPQLKSASDLVISDNQGLNSVDFGMLQNSQNITIKNNASLATVNFAQLTSALEMMIATNQGLNSVDFSSLLNSGNITLTNNTGGANVLFSALKTAGNVLITGNDLFNLVDMGALDSIPELTVQQNTQFSGLVLTSLRKCKNMYIMDVSGLTALNMPNLLMYPEPNWVNNVSSGPGSSQNGQFLRIENCPDLQSLVLTQLQNIVNLYIQNNTALQSVDLTGLVKTQRIEFVNNGNVALLDFASLTSRSTSVFDLSILNIKNSGVAIVRMPLVEVVGEFWVQNNNQLTELSLSNLKNMRGSMVIENNALLNTIDFSSMTQMLSSTSFTTDLRVKNNTSLSSLSFPALTKIAPSYASLDLSGNTNLITIDWPSYNDATASYYGSIDFRNCALSSAEVNKHLANFVGFTFSGYNRKASFEGQNPPAPPTGQGITDKATMITNGWTVTTD